MDEKMIRKLGPAKFRLYGKNTGKNLGTFKTKTAALKHEADVRFFMHRRSK
jgi:Sec-independent protein translocase protein TatA